MIIVQDLSLFFAILSFILMFYWARKNPGIKNYLIPVSMWMGHNLVFYIAYFLYINGVNYHFTFNSIFFSNWSAYLRFHGIFTVFYFLTIMSDITHDIEKRIEKWVHQ